MKRNSDGETGPAPKRHRAMGDTELRLLVYSKVIPSFSLETVSLLLLLLHLLLRCSSFFAHSRRFDGWRRIDRYGAARVTTANWLLFFTTTLHRRIGRRIDHRQGRQQHFQAAH